MNVITVLIAVAAICASAGDAFAGGMLLPVRGVRTVERAGARIAGADDADSLWLDPAGLAHLAGEVGPSCCSMSRMSLRVSTARGSTAG